MKNLFILFSFLLVTSTTWACSCIGKNDINKEFKASDLVIIGTVVDSQVVQIWSDTNHFFTHKKDSLFNEAPPLFTIFLKDVYSIKLIEYTVIITESLKGSKKSDTVLVRTGFGGGDCGFQFTIGESYLIYAKDEYKIKYNEDKLKRSKKEVKGIFRTNICYRTKSISKATEELSHLRKK